MASRLLNSGDCEKVSKLALCFPWQHICLRLVLKSRLKRLLLGSGRHGRRIPFGLYKGLVLSIDPASEMSFWLGLYEVETTPWLRTAGREATIMVDVGAGYGEMSAWALRQPDMKRVLAYDSKPQRWPVFRENMALNGMANDHRLTAIEGLFLGGEESSAALAALESLPEPILFKIDIDGGEEAVLKRMRDLLASRQCLLLIETHSEELDVACGELLESAGYRIRRLSPAWWRQIIRERRPIGFNQWIVAQRPSP